MTAPEGRRRRIVPVACQTVRGEPDGIHLAVEEWLPRYEGWVTGPALCGQSAKQGALSADTAITCTGADGSCESYRDSYQRALDGRPTAQQELITSLRDEVARLTAELEASHTARLNEPILRHCLYPRCLREYDVNATLCGRDPDRPTWSGKGWLQVRQLDGDICPDHAHVVGNQVAPGPHLPRWSYGSGDAPSTLRCPCGWDSPPVRWRRYATEAWKNHILAAEGDPTA
ncbi:hypothetical protein ACFVJK_30715 [Streptomyces sp. NPDC127172]|uniref:hypothetical protein n=1 Tax=Streptomyces sp. NPDC127172 TaxID=3345382 RepID=UPI00362D5347